MKCKFIFVIFLFKPIFLGKQRLKSENKPLNNFRFCNTEKGVYLKDLDYC